MRHHGEPLILIPLQLEILALQRGHMVVDSQQRLVQPVVAAKPGRTIH